MEEVEVMDKVVAKVEKKISDAKDPTPKREIDNAIIPILEDQHPHSVAEMASRVNLSAEKIQHVFRFLAKYSLITYDEQSKTAVICDDFLSLK